MQLVKITFNVNKLQLLKQKKRSDKGGGSLPFVRSVIGQNHNGGC